jgi:hypothetical protein
MTVSRNVLPMCNARHNQLLRVEQELGAQAGMRQAAPKALA